MSVSSGNMPSVAKLEEILTAANKALRGERWKEATALFDHAIQLKPQYLKGWLGKASARNGAGDAEGAVESYKKALEVDAGCKEAWIGLIDTYHELGLSEEEVEACDCLLRLSPRSDDILLNKGVALHMLGKMENALECFEQVVERRPESVIALNNKGAVLLRMGRFQEALDTFDTALTLAPDNREVQRNRCLLLLRLGRFGAAVMAADEMMAVKEEGWLLMLKGLAHVELKELLLAVQSLEKAKELSPDLEGIDKALERARSLKESMSKPESAINSDGSPLTLTEKGQTMLTPQALGTLLFNIGYPSESLRIWKHCMREDNPYDWLAVGKAMVAGGEISTGEKCLNEARRLGAATTSKNLTTSELPAIWREIAGRSAEGWTDDALGILEKVLKDKPDLEKAWQWLGVMRAMSGDYPNAETAFRQVMHLEPGSPTALSNLGAVLVCAGRLQEAAETLRRAFKTDSNHFEVMHNLAFVESRLGRYEEARELLRMSLNIEERPATLVLLGNVLESLNRNREASKCYERCLALQARNKMAKDGVARTKAKLLSGKKASKANVKASTVKGIGTRIPKGNPGNLPHDRTKRVPGPDRSFGPGRMSTHQSKKSEKPGRPLGK